MGKLETFEIIFTHPQAVFFAGQVVSGSVHVVASEPLNMRGMSMKIFGKGKVHWSVASGKTRKHYRAEEIYCDCKIDLLNPESAAQESLTLPAGSFKYPFQMALPSTLPSSFEGKHGYVRYLAEAKIDRPWKFDHELKTAFTVLSILDLNLEQSYLRDSYRMTQDKDVGCCCCISGVVDATVDINRRCFVPGETIYMNVKITNNSNSQIPNCSAVLDQNIQFLAQSTNFFSSGQYHSKIRNETIARVDLSSVAGGSTADWNNIPLIVPSIPPSRLVGCQIINITYILTVDINTDYTDFKLPVEIIIGTVPLRGQYQPSPVAITQPTAPLPPHDFNSDPPPPFPTDSGFFYDMPPPSYEECVQGKVTIKEETDSEFVRGDLNWAPVYAMYRQPSANLS